jgi:hypothetical protein
VIVVEEPALAVGAAAVVSERAVGTERRLAARRLDCSFVFHRNREPLGDFRKLWAKACAKVDLKGWSTTSAAAARST